MKLKFLSERENIITDDIFTPIVLMKAGTLVRYTILFSINMLLEPSSG